MSTRTVWKGRCENAGGCYKKGHVNRSVHAKTLYWNFTVWNPGYSITMPTVNQRSLCSLCFFSTSKKVKLEIKTFFYFDNSREKIHIIEIAQCQPKDRSLWLSSRWR